MQYEVTIPHFYVWMTEGYQNRGDMFKGYVKGYIAKTYPGYDLIKIQEMTAIIERREGYEERQKANQKAKNSSKRKRTKS